MTGRSPYVPALLGLLALLAWAGLARAAEPPDSTAAEPKTIWAIIAPDSLTAAQGDTSGAHRSTFSFYPYAYYTPETALAFGLGGVMTLYTGESRVLRPSKIPVSGYLSTSGQYSVSVSPEIYLNENRQFASLNLSFGHLVDKFYGIDATGDTQGNEQFTADSFNLQFGFQFPSFMKISDRAGLFYRYRYYDVVDRRDNPYFDDPAVVGEEGGHISGLGLEWAWDSRHPTFWPETGVRHRISYTAYPKELGSDFNHTRFEIDLRQYRKLGDRRVLAIRLYTAVVDGDVPFYELPSLGGSSLLRGIYAGRYRDRSAVAGQAEYRWQSNGKWGVVGFLGAGGTAPGISTQRLDQFHVAGGAGIRYLFNPTERINLRADIGFARDSNGVYFGLEEAF